MKQPAHSRGLPQTGSFGLACVLAAALTLSAFVKVGNSDPLSSIGGVQSIYESLVLLASTALLLLQLGGSLDLALFTREPFRSASVYALFATASAVWSVEPTLSAGKGIELLLVVVNGAAFVQAIHRQRLQARFFDFIAVATFVVFLVFILANYFLFYGTLIYMQFSEYDQRNRFWLAANHPLATADMAALGLLCALRSGLHNIFKLGLIGFFGWIIYLTGARAPLIGLFLAFLAFIALRNHLGKALATRIVLLLVLVAATVAAGIFFLLSNEDFLRSLPKETQTLGGRTLLWSYSLDLALSDSLKMVIGWGYFGTRFLLLSLFPWAGHTHQVLLEILLSTGIIGLAIFVCFAWAVCRLALREIGLLILLPYLAVVSFDNPVLFLPVASMVVMIWVAGHVGLETGTAQVAQDRSEIPPPTRPGGETRHPRRSRLASAVSSTERM